MTSIRLRRTAAALASAAAALLAACATPQPATPPVRSLEDARASLPQSSPECLAAKLKPSEPFTAAAIPPEVLKRAQNGWVAIRYDVIAGKAQNLAVVGSQPAGLYDAAALAHAARYREPAGTTVRGCIMTIDIRF